MSYFSKIAVDLIRDHGKKDYFFKCLAGNCNVPRQLIAELHDTLVRHNEIVHFLDLPESELKPIREIVRPIFRNKDHAIELGKCVHVVRSIYETN